jgi:hypothetical protein
LPALTATPQSAGRYFFFEAGLRNAGGVAVGFGFSALGLRTSRLLLF